MGQINISESPEVWNVFAGGARIGQSSRAIELREGAYQPVLYFPRQDIAMDLLEKTDRTTMCPHKGAATYYSIVTPSGRIENAVWSYEAPKQPMGSIAGYLAFYPDKAIIARQSDTSVAASGR